MRISLLNWLALRLDSQFLLAQAEQVLRYTSCQKHSMLAISTSAGTSKTSSQRELR